MRSGLGLIAAVVVAAVGLGSEVTSAQAPPDATLTLVAIDFSGNPYPADSTFSLIATGPGGTLDGPSGVSGPLPAGEYQLEFRDETPLVDFDGQLVPGGVYFAEMTDCTNAPSAVESVTLAPGEVVTCTYLLSLAVPSFPPRPPNVQPPIERPPSVPNVLAPAFVPNVQVPAAQRDLPSTGTDDPLAHAMVAGVLVAVGLALVRVAGRRSA